MSRLVQVSGRLAPLGGHCGAANAQFHSQFQQLQSPIRFPFQMQSQFHLLLQSEQSSEQFEQFGGSLGVV